MVNSKTINAVIALSLIGFGVVALTMSKRKEKPNIKPMSKAQLYDVLKNSGYPNPNMNNDDEENKSNFLKNINLIQMM